MKLPIALIASPISQSPNYLLSGSSLSERSAEPKVVNGTNLHVMDCEWILFASVWTTHRPGSNEMI